MMRDLRRRLGFGLAMASVLMTAQGAQASDAALERCVATQAKAMDFSGVVLISRGQDVTTYATGVRGGPGSPAITAHTLFDLASSGKMFTGTAVAQLVEKGMVGLDDPIGHYVDGLTPETSAVTVRQLLSHRSGLPDIFQSLKPEDQEKLEAERRITDLLPLIASAKPAFTPGTKYQYSSTGYLLLGMLIERASGLSYDAYLKQNVFGPAGMTSTTAKPSRGADYALGMTHLDPADPMASLPPPGSQQPWGRPNAPLYADSTRPRGSSAGGYYSTVGDMRRFFLALTNGTLVRPQMLQMMATAWSVARPAGDGKPESGYGFGLGINTVNGHRSIGHAGGMPGGNTATNFFPDDGVAAIVLANRDPPLAQQLYASVAPAIFDTADLNHCVMGDRQ
jgi:D-alanyl-D-alanine carboxypeptidase